MFRVAIVGGKDTNNYENFRIKCISLLKNKAKEGIFILSTGDDFVDEFAMRYKIDVQNFYTDFAKFANLALKKRNELLLDNCDALIAFLPERKDIQHIISMAEEKHIPIRRVKTT